MSITTFARSSFRTTLTSSVGSSTEGTLAKHCLTGLWWLLFHTKINLGITLSNHIPELQQKRGQTDELQPAPYNTSFQIVLRLFSLNAEGGNGIGVRIACAQRGHANIAQLQQRRESDFLKNWVVHDIVEHLVAENRSPSVSVRTYIKVICDDTSVFSLIGRSIEKP